MTEKSNVRFASGKKFIESMRYQGLTDGDAIKEFIDNSLDANADNVYINIWDEGSGINIMIQDDGDGMDKDLLERAPAFGQSGVEDDEKIGRFGFGMPTAITSKTRKADIFSKREVKWLHTYVDLDDLAKTEDMRLPSADEKSPEEIYGKKLVKQAKTGTVIVMKDCDRLQNEKVSTVSGKIKKELEMTYRIFMHEGKNIFLNGEQLKPMDPLMTIKNHAMREGLIKGLKEEEVTGDTGYSKDIGEIEDIVVDCVDREGKPTKARVKIKLVLLPIKDIDRTGGATKYGISYEAQGFYLMRNKRQIAGPTNLGFYKSHPMLTYFRGEVSFDSLLDDKFGIQVNKSRFHLSKSMETQIRDRVKGLIATARREQYKIMHEIHATDDKMTGVAEEIAKSAQYRKSKKLKSVTGKDIAKAVKDESSKIDKDTTIGQSKRDEIKEKIRDALEKELPFILETDHNRQGPMFTWDYLGKSTKIMLNREHPFYKFVWLALTKENCPAIYRKTILKLLIFTLVKGEQIQKEEMEEGNIISQEELQGHWNLILRKFLGSDKFLSFYENQELEDILGDESDVEEDAEE